MPRKNSRLPRGIVSPFRVDASRTSLLRGTDRRRRVHRFVNRSLPCTGKGPKACLSDLTGRQVIDRLSHNERYCSQRSLPRLTSSWQSRNERNIRLLHPRIIWQPEAFSQAVNPLSPVARKYPIRGYARFGKNSVLFLKKRKKEKYKKSGDSIEMCINTKIWSADGKTDHFKDSSRARSYVHAIKNNRI